MVLENLAELRRDATELRKSKKFGEAKEKYSALWENSHDVWDGTGLLDCLRKLGEFDKAIPLADELLPLCGDNNWCRNEIIWTYISGVLLKLGENEPLKKTSDIADKIMSLGPEDIALEMTVFEILKRAKAAGDWKVVDEWVTKITPENISVEPMKFGNGKEGWSRRAQWYNYRVNSLIEADKCEDAIKIVEDILPQFSKERKFFMRLKAIGLHKLGRLDEARDIFGELCKNPHIDWWILHDYAKLLKDVNEPEQALKLMFRAASLNSKLEETVKLLEEIGTLAEELNRPPESMPHLYLVKYVREKNGWKLSKNLTVQLQKVSETIPNTTPPADIKQALTQCRDIWNQYLPKSPGPNTTAKKGLKGKVNIGNPDRHFCFIRVDGSDNYFCFKSELPAGTKDGDRVTFDVVPSYDKKKQKDSWRAINVRSVSLAT